MPVPVMVCGDDISLIINKNNLIITFFFHDNIVVTDWYLFFTCTFLFLIIFSFAEHLISKQAMLYVWVMRYQSLEINYHTSSADKFQKAHKITFLFLPFSHRTHNILIFQIWQSSCNMYRKYREEYRKMNHIVTDCLVTHTGWETSARPLANGSENLAGRVENRLGEWNFV